MIEHETTPPEVCAWICGEFTNYCDHGYHDICQRAASLRSFGYTPSLSCLCSCHVPHSDEGEGSR